MSTFETRAIRLSEVVFDEVIYPRKDHDPALVQRYADVLDEIEAAGKLIAVAEDMKLLDGKHRWLAYRKRHEGEDREIQVRVYPVTAPHDQLELAAKLNSDHGYQLSTADKEETAKTLYSYGMSYDRIAAALSVSKKRVGDWLARIVKDNKDKRDKKIVEMWMACDTQEEIAKATTCDQKTASNVVEDFRKSVLENQIPKITSEAAFATDFDPPIYNVWKWKETDSKTAHFGNSNAAIVERLLYLYTKPFDVVLDPFGGGGSTIDVCKKRWRRYLVSDRKPIVERETEIRQHDIKDGPLGQKGVWPDASLVYLDPPYWVQAAGQYSEDAADLANMPLEQFTEALAGLVRQYLKKLHSGAHVALIIQPTQWKAPEKRFTDHIADLLRAVDAPLEMRIQAPYESQQCTAQQVEWAKANRQLLVISREVIVWRKE